MRRILAVLNILGAIPLVAIVIRLGIILFEAGPVDAAGTPGILGGSDDPTTIMAASPPDAPLLAALAFYAALLVCNAISFWKCSRHNPKHGHLS